MTLRTPSPDVPLNSGLIHLITNVLDQGVSKLQPNSQTQRTVGFTYLKKKKKIEKLSRKTLSWYEKMI